MKQEELAKFGIDLEALRLVPTAGVGRRAWPPLWRAAVETLFVNGFSPDAINTALGISIDRSTIYDWANENGWWVKREEFQKRVAQTALAKVEESAADITARQVKGLRAFQATLLKGLTSANGQTPPGIKTLEGATAAYVTAVKAERQIRGMAGGADVTVETKGGGDTLNIDLDSLDRLPPEARERAFELYRRRMELEEELNALATGETTVIEGSYREDEHPTHPTEASGAEPSPEVPEVREDDEGSGEGGTLP